MITGNQETILIKPNPPREGGGKGMPMPLSSEQEAPDFIQEKKEALYSYIVMVRISTEAPLKDDKDNVRHFPTREEATAEARRLSAQPRGDGASFTYSVEKLD